MNNIMETITMREEKCNTMRERKGAPDMVSCSGVVACPEFYNARQLWSPRGGGKTPHYMRFSSSYIEPH